MTRSIGKRKAESRRSSRFANTRVRCFRIGRAGSRCCTGRARSGRALCWRLGRWTALTALSIIGFPSGKLADNVMSAILRGGLEKMAEAGVPVIGGHSIQDSEIKAGFAVTGLIARERVTKRAGAREGDVLVLTKPLGTVVVCFAAQIGRAPDEVLSPAVHSMTSLNRTASEIMQRHGAHACTDVTGFGLLGHLAEMARTSGVDMEIAWNDIPLLPGSLDLARAGVIPGGDGPESRGVVRATGHRRRSRCDGAGTLSRSPDIRRASDFPPRGKRCRVALRLA
ncbi:MAG: selenide, water dikinase SelD [Terrimicrobiaceae bacterium]